MRYSLPLALLALSLFAFPANSLAAAKSTATPRLAPAIAEQQALVKRAAASRYQPAYAEALLELAHRYRQAGQAKNALKAAQEASDAFDQLVEVHKGLSDVLLEFERARAERRLAHDFGLRRDEAIFFTAELARAQGDADLAAKNYLTVVESEPDQPLGQKALAQLTAMGIAAPAPSAAPSADPSARP